MKRLFAAIVSAYVRSVGLRICHYANPLGARWLAWVEDRCGKCRGFIDLDGTFTAWSA
jgi:hypothetical protein